MFKRRVTDTETIDVCARIAPYVGAQPTVPVAGKLGALVWDPEPVPLTAGRGVVAAAGV